MLWDYQLDHFLKRILDAVHLMHNRELTYRIMRHMEDKGEPGTAEKAASIVRGILKEWPDEGPGE